MKKIICLTTFTVLIIIAGVLYKLNQMNAFIWLPDYITNSPTFEETDGITDIIFVVIDHWEPGGNEYPLLAWMENYRKLADKHIDSDGIKLQHTWYYPIDQFRGNEVDSIVQLSREGYGDVELHFHHHGDDSESFRKKMKAGLDSLRAHGALRTDDSLGYFSFVHGNWALDNSRAGQGSGMYGVDDEISILKELGCYADFTFPAMTQTAQPSLVNKIYYCVDDPDKPKSHDEGTVSSVGYSPNEEEFMIFEGPYMIDWSDWRFKTHPTFEDGNLYWEIPTTFDRFETWLSANIHVKDRPNWQFVRPFTHGCDLRHEDAFDNILGKNIDKMLTEVEKKYKNSENYRLHYMTAREAYNVVKAAEAGHNGNPNDYRDFILPKYNYTPDSLLNLGK